MMLPHVKAPRREAIVHVHVQQPAYYRGESRKLNDLRALLFMHYARECKATSSPLAVDGFSQWSVKDKLKKMRKVCWATT